MLRENTFYNAMQGYQIDMPINLIPLRRFMLTSPHRSFITSLGSQLEWFIHSAEQRKKRLSQKHRDSLLLDKYSQLNNLASHNDFYCTDILCSSYPHKINTINQTRNINPGNSGINVLIVENGLSTI